MKHIDTIFGWLLILCITSSLNIHATQQYNIGLLIVATGKYIQFVQPLIESARKHFLPHHNITYFVFTEGTPPAGNDIIKIHQERLGWPYDTMMRYKMYAEHADAYKDMDYLFATDADMLFVNTVGDEILGDRVATQHPGFVGKRGTYETRSISRAYVKPGEGRYYLAGGFNGGSKDSFLQMAQIITQKILEDLEHNIIAIWHDESHLNRFYIDNPPTIILNPSYCYPESWQLPYPKKLLALDKNHNAIRA
ncbi:MAG TPA: hypothetical protein PLU71_04635 [Candidatus Dependentiae bacterium]|nr:hypothetical protein [Candidatus Dependentiae bacterium]HRQ63120.1 hypothetical protein [Candidatus Dependentiae bacterium]